MIPLCPRGPIFWLLRPGWLAGRAGWPVWMAGLAGTPGAEVPRQVEGNGIIPGAHSSILHPSCLHAGCRMQDTGNRMQDAGCRDTRMQEYKDGPYGSVRLIKRPPNTTNYAWEKIYKQGGQGPGRARARVRARPCPAFPPYLHPNDLDFSQ